MYEVQANIQATVNFEIGTNDPDQAEVIVKEYLKYVQYGKLQKHGLNIQTKASDKLTSLFIMDCEIEDVNEV